MVFVLCISKVGRYSVAISISISMSISSCPPFLFLQVKRLAQPSPAQLAGEAMKGYR